MKARDIAAEEFKQHSKDSAHNDLDALHVVVAHSHGEMLLSNDKIEAVRIGAASESALIALLDRS